MSSWSTWLPSAVGAQLAFAGAVYADKALLDRRAHDPREFATAVGIIDLGVAGVLLLWLGPGDAALGERLLMLLAGGLLYLYLVPYLRALRLDDASTVAPLFQLVPLFTLVLAWLFLGETLGRAEALGFLVVGVGALLFILGDGVVPWRVRAKTARFMAVSSFMLAAELVLLDDLLSHHSYGPTLAWVLVGLGIAGLVSAALRRVSGVARTRLALGLNGWAVLGLGEALSLVGEALATYALVAGPASLVAVLSATEPVFLLVIGLGLTTWVPSVTVERVGRRAVAAKVLASAVLLAGVGIIAYASSG